MLIDKLLFVSYLLIILDDNIILGLFGIDLELYLLVGYILNKGVFMEDKIKVRVSVEEKEVFVKIVIK